ncbi:unnamed protein product [Rotaria magnacalcarata]|uniref:Uncharacterized protein n=2 Tax=Rotaria magnacalcarata TaxID=392030 RepID=A0A816U1C1_9BILA|nr:unnamed protein product [Rotaria magnacalcarata]
MDNNLVALFRVDTYGGENHSEDNIMRPRKMDAQERDCKRANEVGPLATFRERIEIADEKILAADSTGGVLKPMKEQNDVHVYTIMFKDGVDAMDNVPLAHAILTDHTVPVIGYFLGNVIHSANQVTTKKKLRPPSFIIIDFSAALMNAALQQFNIETVNKHLKRCWNVIHRKYSAENIRSLSFIHLCCCHVMHAIARSLNAEKLEKKHEKLTAEEKEEELKLVDEYFESDEPIIHQSPFNKEAIKRYPLLDEIVIKKKIKANNNNTFFSASIMRIFYRWWAYLPLWTDVSANINHQQNEISIENSLNTNSSFIVPNNLNIVNEQYKVTTHQFSKDLSIKIPSNPEITISGFTLKWPTFEIKNVMYTGQAYTLYNTCAIDSALFSLYFIYVTDEIISSELKEAAESSPYATLIKTFNIVEKEGWDVARIYWLLKCNILKTTGRLMRDLFGSVDELVSSFLKSRQRHSNEIIYSRPDCTKKERKCTSTDLTIFSTDENSDKFEIETEGVCPITVKRREEISEAEALQKKYRDGRVPFFNCETNKNEYERGWICNSTNIHTSATFDYGHPPIIIVNIKLFSKRIDEGYEPNPVRLRDLKDTIRICSIKYKLRAVINHRDAHFTATLIGPDKELYIYDNRQGVRPTRTSPDRVEIAAYTQIYEY